MIAGCANQSEQAPAPRPVRQFRVGERNFDNAAGFAGEVKARRETTQAFRVPGKLAERVVETGGLVRKGQLLARLEADDHRLAIQSLNAQRVSARAEENFKRGELSRYRELLDQQVISPPELDRHETDYIAAKERVVALDVQLRQAKNQLDYTNLWAERDGVITAIEVEAGDIVAVAQPVVRLAQLDEKDVIIDVPEHRIHEISLDQTFFVVLWTDETQRLKARVREIASEADPVTRTYRVKVALMEGLTKAGLGMTATVWIPAAAASRIAIPLAAVFTLQAEPGQSRVWLVDANAGTVSSRPVQLGQTIAGDFIEVSGLAAGQFIVSAGVQRLIEGQKIRPMPADSGKAADRQP
jgi:multidrug efflux system membrane fusion protein